MSKDTYYRGDDIRLPYQFQNADGSVLNVTNISIITELRKEGYPIKQYDGKTIDITVHRSNNGDNFEVLIPRDITKLLPKNNNYELLVKLEDSTPHLTTWDKYPFVLS